MTYKMLSVFDSKAELYLTPFIMKTKAEAIRGFTDVVNDPKTSFFAHPEDYTLMEIGEYDDNKGELKNHLAKIALANGLEVKRQDPQLSLPLGNGQAGAPRLANKEEKRINA